MVKQRTPEDVMKALADGQEQVMEDGGIIHAGAVWDASETCRPRYLFPPPDLLGNKAFARRIGGFEERLTTSRDSPVAAEL